MRLILTYALASSILVGSGYWAGLQRGWNKGFGEGASLTKTGGFVAGFETLRLLRQGDLTNSVERLEAFCYATAADLFEQPGKYGGTIVKLYGKELKDYRATYKNPPGRQSPTEQRLDAILTKADSASSLGL